MLGGLGKPRTKINIQLHKNVGKESKTVLDVNVNSIYSPWWIVFDVLWEKIEKDLKKNMNSKNHCIGFWKAAHRFLSQNSRQSPQHPLMPSANRQPELRGSNELCSVARSNHIEVTFCLQKWMKTIFPEMMCDICDFVLGSNVSNSRDAVVFKLYKLQEKYVKKRGKPIEIQWYSVLTSRV